MMNEIGSLETVSATSALAGKSVNEVEQLARRGELLRASQKFEAYFVSYMMKVMRETIPQGELTANKMGEMFYSFYYEELGNRAAQSGGMGLSDYVLSAVSGNEDLVRSPSNPSTSVKFQGVE
jgi:flagellar protein FlgJ